jgi:fumarate hydratase, class II
MLSLPPSQRETGRLCLYVLRTIKDDRETRRRLAQSSACLCHRIASFHADKLQLAWLADRTELVGTTRRAKERPMTSTRKETDSLGVVEVPADKLWGAQTQRSLEHFSIGKDLIPREMITAYATLKKAAAIANHDGKRLDDQRYQLIVQTCDEILAGQHQDMFPLHVWMTGSGTQFNMNVNEVISNRCCQLAGTPLGSHAPVHPNDHVNMAQSSNDSFPSAMCIAAAVNVKERLLPAVTALRDAIDAKSRAWDDIIKIGRTHMQDATPLTLGQEWSGYAGMLSDNLERIETALSGVYRLALGGTAVGTGINSAPGFAEAAAAQIARLTGLPFVTAPNKFTVQGAHDAQVQLSGTMRTLAVSLYKIANDIRLMSCGPRAGFAELKIPENEPGSSIMPGKVNPTQCEALAMIAAQVMANDVAVGLGGAGGYLEMNVYKPLIIFNITHSTTIMTDGCVNFRKFLIEGTEPNLKKINEYVERSLMLVTALSPVIGYDKASKIAHYAMDNDLTLKAAALKLGFVTEAEFDRVVDPKKMVKPHVAGAPSTAHAA